MQYEEALVLADEDHLVKYNEKPGNMAEWMAVTLSATSVALSEPAPRESARDVETSASFPQDLLNIPRAFPKSDQPSPQVVFSANEIDVQALDRYDITWKQELTADVSLVLKAEIEGN
jgi:hypothetical protein